jgi:hypothetical protein
MCRSVGRLRLLIRLVPISEDEERAHYPNQHQAQPNQELCPQMSEKERSTGRRPAQRCVGDPSIGASCTDDPPPKPVEGKGEPSHDDDTLSGIQAVKRHSQSVSDRQRHPAPVHRKAMLGTPHEDADDHISRAIR